TITTMVKTAEITMRATTDHLPRYGASSCVRNSGNHSRSVGADRDDSTPTSLPEASAGHESQQQLIRRDGRVPGRHSVDECGRGNAMRDGPNSEFSAHREVQASACRLNPHRV